MDPELIRAARALVAARQTHPDLTSGEAEQITQSYGHKADDVVSYIQKLRSDHGDLVSSGLKGFTANWGDELIGLLPKALGGGEAGKEEFRLRNELAKMDHPIAAPATELAGGIGSAALTGGVLPEIQGATRVATAAKTAAAVGGGYGAVAGAGEGENLPDRARNAAVGGVTGAAFGGALGAAGARVAEAISPAARALQMNLDAIERSGGFQAVKQMLANMRGAGRGAEVVGADLSTPLRDLGDFAANNNRGVFDKASDMLETRKANVPERLTNDIQELTPGGALPEAAGRANDLASSKNTWADVAYSSMRNNDTKFSGADLGQYIQKPVIKNALDQAKLADDISSGGEMEKQLNELIARVQGGSRAPEDMAAMKEIANTGVTPTRPLSFNDMHQLARALDGRVGTAYAKGNVPLAQAWKGARDQVLNAITGKVPEFADTQAEYGARTQLQEMLAKGVDTWNKTSVRDLTSNMSKLSPQNAEQFRYGLASKLVDAVGDNRFLGNLNKQSMQLKLQTIFGDEPTFDSFMARAKSEKMMAKTNSVVGGSQTYKRSADASTAVGSALSFLSGHSSGAYILGKAISKLAGKNIGEETAAKVGAGVFAQGADKVDSFLQSLVQPVNFLGAGKTKAAGFAGGLLAPAMSSLFQHE